MTECLVAKVFTTDQQAHRLAFDALYPLLAKTPGTVSSFGILLRYPPSFRNGETGKVHTCQLVGLADKPVAHAGPGVISEAPET